LEIPSKNFSIETVTKESPKYATEAKTQSNSDLKSPNANGTFNWELAQSKIDTKLPSHVKSILSLYERDWFLCKRKSEKHGSYPDLHSVMTNIDDHPSLSFEIDRKEILKIAGDLNIKDQEQAKSNVSKIFPKRDSLTEKEEVEDLEKDFVNTSNKKIYEGIKAKQVSPSESSLLNAKFPNRCDSIYSKYFKTLMHQSSLKAHSSIFQALLPRKLEERF
jgi:hypothetical protein